MGRNTFQEYAKRVFNRVKREIKDPEVRKDMESGLNALNRADYLYEKWIEDAKMIGVRNPSFDGDFVGWLDDDFDKDDDDKDSKNKPKK